MNALTLIFVALCVFALAYRFYGLWIANRVLELKVDRLTPSVKMADGIDYVQTNKFVLFGHHFAAIAAAGPLLGPVLAAQYGYLPGALWIIIGAVVAGAVHDMVVLFASVRHKAQSLGKIAESEIGKTVGNVASVAILFILILTLAGLSLAVVNAMFSSPWGTFTVFSTIPIALLDGALSARLAARRRPGRQHHRRRPAVCGGPGRTLYRGTSGPGLLVHPEQESNCHLYPDLRLCGFGAAGLAAPLPPGLSLHLPEDRHHLGPGPGNFICPAATS